MSDKLPSFGLGRPRDCSKPKRMLYQQPSFTLPASQNCDQLRWDLAMGYITEDEYNAMVKQREVAAVKPAQERAVVTTPSHR